MPVKWSLAPGSPGTIDESGTYHAPAHVQVNNSMAGCQILPNDHILNTRVDALPLSSKSAEFMALLPSSRFNYYQSWGTNIADSSTPRQNIHFLYTQDNDGKYEIPEWPGLMRENGIFSRMDSGVDRHVLTVDRESCQVYELYNNYAPGEYKDCPKCSANGGVAYSGMSYELPSGASDAAGLFIAPLSIHLSEIRAGVIKHAGRFTLGNNFINPSSVWPSHSHAGAWGKVPYGTRFRLRPDYDISGFSPIAKILLTQLKDYGIFLADGGGNWEIQTATDVTLDPATEAAFLEVRSKGPGSKDMQVVDESSLLLSENSGQINPRNPYVKDDSAATIIATDAGNPDNSSQIRVPLRGITVGVADPSIWIQSSVKTQLMAWVNGTNDKALKWSMSPALGTLSASGYYTPPNVDHPTTTLVTVASEADPLAIAQISLTVMPPGAIRVKLGNATAAPGAPNKNAPDYGPDSEGHMWWRDQAGEISWGVVHDDWYGQPWPKQKDISLYYTSRYSFGDMVYKFRVANGNYKISVYFAQPECKTQYPKEYRAPIHLEAQGQIVLHDLDVGAAIDHACLTPAIQSIPAIVKDNSLYFAERRITFADIKPSPLFNAYSIVPDSSPAHLAIDPAKPRDMLAGDKTHLYAIGWYMSSDVNWSLEGPGSISPDGVYAAPLIPPKNDQRVTLTARSKSDASKSTSVEISLKTGDMAISPATASTVRSLATPFKVKFGNANYTNLDWSVSPNIGSISANGVYTAPDSLGEDTTVQINARSKDLPDHMISATLLVRSKPDTIRIACGEGPGFRDAQGNIWSDDHGYYSADTVQYRVAAPIQGASPDMQRLYQSSRYRYAGEPFNYIFNVPNGRYAVTLKFADYGEHQAGFYSFDVKLNGKKVLDQFDPDKEKGYRWAIDKSFETTVSNRNIRLDFLASKAGAFINGIEIRYLGP